MNVTANIDTTGLIGMVSKQRLGGYRGLTYHTIYSGQLGYYQVALTDSSRSYGLQV